MIPVCDRRDQATLFRGKSMSSEIATLMSRIEPDPWRSKAGFSSEMRAALDVTLNSKSVAEIESALNAWIRKYQPCLFGRIAAKQSAITYCIVSEEMLCGDEVKLKDHIQEARLRWTAAGFDGASSNFIIAVLSSRLAFALPSEAVEKIALRLCALYLGESIERDKVYLDRLWLQQPGSQKATWEWVAGVNYFSAQGDGRWWQDHRFPAGMAFSVNSVGHMVKSGKLIRALHDLEEAMGTALPDYRVPNVDSLAKALELAMATINKASETVSGKATFLLPLTNAGDERPKCPVMLPNFLSSFDYCGYEGFYHTDYTIPSAYFRPDIKRPVDAEPYQLDFTYLFDKALDNPDYDRMGDGRRIRDSAELASGASGDERRYPVAKRLRGVATEVQIADVPRLQDALRPGKSR
jgi:hypothetical protein